MSNIGEIGRQALDEHMRFSKLFEEDKDTFELEVRERIHKFILTTDHPTMVQELQLRLDAMMENIKNS
jgi:predicted translin family RNA/ssDNA-binding protein